MPYVPEPVPPSVAPSNAGIRLPRSTDLNGDGRRSTLERELHAKLRAADRDGNGVLDVRRFTRQGTGSHLHYRGGEEEANVHKRTAFFFLGTAALAGLRAGGPAGPFPLSIYGYDYVGASRCQTLRPQSPPTSRTASSLRKLRDPGTAGGEFLSEVPRTSAPLTNTPARGHTRFGAIAHRHRSREAAHLLPLHRPRARSPSRGRREAIALVRERALDCSARKGNSATIRSATYFDQKKCDDCLD